MMAPDPNVRDRVEQRLRQMLSTGDLLPGMAVSIATLARQWLISETPIREIGWRAVGEGWLVPEPRGGFRVWQPDIDELRDTYEALELVLVSAIGLISDQSGKRPDVYYITPDDRIAAPILEIVRLARNQTMIELASGLINRLAPLQRAEQMLLIDHRREADRIIALLGNGSRAALRDEVRRFFRRRKTMASAILGLVGEWRREAERSS